MTVEYKTANFGGLSKEKNPLSNHHSGKELRYNPTCLQLLSVLVIPQPT